MDKFLIYAIIKAESNFDETAVSSKEAKGLMQLMDNTAKYIIKTENITNSYTEESSIDSNKISEILLKPDINIKLGTKYISILINKYKSIELALVAYNAGSGNVDNWIEKWILKDDGANIEEVPYKETNNYVRKILRDYEIYKDLYENN